MKEKKNYYRSTRVNRIKMDKITYNHKKKLALEALDLFDQAAQKELDDAVNDIANFEIKDTRKYVIHNTSWYQTAKNDAEQAWMEATEVRQMITDAVGEENYELAHELQKIMNVLHRRYINGKNGQRR